MLDITTHQLAVQILELLVATPGVTSMLEPGKPGTIRWVNTANGKHYVVTIAHECAVGGNA